MINANNITVEIDGKELVKNVSMDLKPGKLSVILGQNGAGKSTFLKVLSGDITPSSGEIMIDGESLDSVPALNLARKRAVMMQELNLSFSFTVLEVVLMGRIPHTRGLESSEDYNIAMQCLKEAGVQHLVERNFTTLSGGEKQRVQFARILAQLWNKIEDSKPCYLLLDEPLRSLDISHQHSLMNLIKNLAAKNVAVLMILHDLNLAAQYADEVNIMKDGQTYALGSPNEVYKPDILEMAFDCPVHIIQHPYKQCPLVIAASEEKKKLRSVI